MLALDVRLLIVIALAPLVAALIAGLFGRQIGRAGAHSVTIAGVGLSFALSAYALWQLLQGTAAAFDANLYTVFEVGGYSAHVGFLVDRLSAMMMVVVTFVSLLVHVYTIGYMAEDPGYQRFFSYISLFTFAMLMLVMSNNFLQLFFGWEAVGLVSYLLIGFWFKKPSAIFANLKAFLVNRVGDFGFLLGIAGVLYWLGSLDYATVFANRAALIGQGFVPWAGAEWQAATVICVCLFIGAMGKSAQVPLHVWLPDSMEGPTPISALIHAATMVTAGIFMVARMSPLFELSEAALTFVLFIGATTAFFTGLIGIVQNDIKRVVAYSTLSQLGYMTAALGVSAYAAGIFHLMTHAFFKALLFLAAGSVIIGMHHEQDMRRMGGLARKMPITWIATVVGTLALVGFPFLSGYYSKDSIIEAVHHAASHGGSAVGWYGYIALLAGVFVTALYSFRLLYMTFHGKPRWNDPLPVDAHADDSTAAHNAARSHETPTAIHGEAPPVDDHQPGHPWPGVRGDAPVAHQTPAHPHESPWVVTLPLILLAIPSLAIGFLTVGPMVFGDYFQGSIFVAPEHDALGEFGREHFHGAIAFGMHFVSSPAFWLAFAGFVVATVFYLLKPSWPARAQKVLALPYRVLVAKYGFDALYQRVFAQGSVGLGRAFWRGGDAFLIDRVLIDGSARLIDRIAAVARRLQSGFLYHYAFAMIIGLIVLLGAASRWLP